MKLFYCVLIFSFFLISCQSKVSRESAIQLKDTLIYITLQAKNQINSQKFINESCDYLWKLLSDSNCTTDFVRLQSLQQEAIVSNKIVISKLKKIKEIDEEVNYKNNVEAYLIAEKAVLNELAVLILAWKRTKDFKKVEYIYDRLYEKLKLLREKQVLFEQSQIEFNKKYSL